ncbi:MAG: exodeoxyribonuclease V beta subunit, partial [Francisella sp.]
HGFMALIIEVIHTKMQLRQDNKHRVITNILHLAELIKIAENKYKHPNQLIKWYREQIAASENNSEAELRLESDENLIKIVTIHGSKGLEYPVVFIPFASKTNTKKFNAKDFNKYYDKESAQTVYKLGKDEEVKTLVDQEIIDESKRLLYVAITRASQRCYIGVAKFKDGEKSPLGQFLDYQKDNDWAGKVSVITNNSDNYSKLVDVKKYQHSPLRSLSGVEVQMEINTNLQANTIKLANDNWQMLSFSKITKDNHQSVGLEKENDELEATDEAQEVAKSKASLDFRFRAKKGADIGNLMHNVLEHTDFSSGKIDDDILKAQFNRYKVVVEDDYSSLKEWLEECLIAQIPYSPQDSVIPKSSLSLSNCDAESIHTKISSHKNLSNFCLKDISNSKALKEPEFYFPIKNNNLNKSKLIQILTKYRQQNSVVPDIDSESPNQNKEILNQVQHDYSGLTNYKIFGMLHGFIDLIFERDGKYFVADYKSNYLGDNLEDYNQQSMCEKNRSSFYDLQYLIYTVALDKYLQQSLTNYNYGEHFGGVYYLYLRGLKNGFGVYQARPLKAIVAELKELFGVGDV